MKNGIQDIIDTGWQTPKNDFFNIATTESGHFTTNKNSYYGHLFPDEDFSIDISNQKMLASLTEKGMIKTVSFFRDSYYTEDKPGTWVSNGYVQEKGLDTEVELDSHVFSLSAANHEIEYDLMFNAIPRYIHHYAEFEILQLFLPIYLENEQAVSGLIELCAIRGKQPVKLIFPNCYNMKYSDRHNIEINYSEGNRKLHEKIGWMTVTDPNATFNVSNEIMSRLISSSYEHVTQKFGQLKIRNNPELATLIIRKSANALNSISCSTNGDVVGANWGSSPVISRTWLRDMYYASLPAIYFDHDLIKKIILWFAKYEIKPHGDKFHGGIQHSVVNSLNSTILLSFYLKETNDVDFLIQNPNLWQHVLSVVDYLITKRDRKYGLVKSQWISDGIALGEFHTGTQIALWTAVNGISEIYRYLLNDLENAGYYKKIAYQLKKSIIKNCLYLNQQGRKKYLEGISPRDNGLTVDARPYEENVLKQGLEFLSRVTKKHKINLVFHDGEESDTTLAPFYGFSDILDESYLNTLKFAASERNPSYSALSRGISWGNLSEATFPGYITLLMGTVDNKTKFNERITLLSKLTDLDGSWWWWPYEVGNSGSNVIRFNHCGKCGWSDGTFSVLMIKNVLGINFNALKNLLSITPLEIIPSYTWNNFPLSYGLNVDINYQIKDEKRILSLTLHGDIKKTIAIKFGSQSKLLTTDNPIQIETEEE